MNFGATIRVNRIGLCILCCVIVLFIIYLSPDRNSSLSTDVHSVNLRRLLLVAIEAAENGGNEVVKALNAKTMKEESKGETREGVNVPVTDADYKSHCVMYYGISKIFPNIKVISEEKEVEKNCEVVPLEVDPDGNLGVHNLPDEKVLASHVAVWIDPLDATKEYTEKQLQYVSTMVCVSLEGKPIIGVIHKPFGDEPKTYWAWLNKGHSPQLTKLQETTDMNKVIVSLSHSGNVEKQLKPIFGENVAIIKAGGSGFKSLELAFGNVSAYVHKTEISKWDICAGDAIITALGGVFTSLSGQDIDYSPSLPYITKDGVFSTNSVLYEKYRDKIASLLKTIDH